MVHKESEIGRLLAMLLVYEDPRESLDLFMEGLAGLLFSASAMWEPPVGAVFLCEMYGLSMASRVLEVDVRVGEGEGRDVHSISVVWPRTKWEWRFTRDLCRNAWIHERLSRIAFMDMPHRKRELADLLNRIQWQWVNWINGSAHESGPPRGTCAYVFYSEY